MLSNRPSSVPDKEDKKLLAGKSASYIIGWNKVKHRGDKHDTARTTESVEGTAPRKARNRNPAKGEGI